MNNFYVSNHGLQQFENKTAIFQQLGSESSPDFAARRKAMSVEGKPRKPSGKTLQDLTQENLPGIKQDFAQRA
jgi:hypothetical protein